MKLRRTTPEIYKVPLNDCATDMAFRFPDAPNSAYMRLSLDGVDIYAMHKYLTGSEEQAIEAIIDDLAINNEDLYVFDESENDQGLVNAEWVNDNIEKLWAFISLTSGHIFLTHRDELVIPLNAELTVEDMRAPN